MNNQKHPWKYPLRDYQEIRKTGKELFHNGSEELTQDLLSFWQWSGSDVLSNVWRGVLAEYIVSLAARCKSEIREEWSSYDLKTPEGIKIEVKSSSYLQSWYQEKHSDILFGIAETWGWDASTNEYSEEKQRHADLYVFCVLEHKDKNTIDPLNLEQWTFYVLSTDVLEGKFLKRKTITLSALLKLKPDLCECKYDQLGARIKEIGLQYKRR